ncbi:MAG: DUF1501 domain-containing protein [Actinobacteria bacterium]|nr:DUF1501 domain-containing protein [Actinomycetota bacterium]
MTASIDRRQFLKGAGTLLVATAAGGILLDVLLPGDGSPAAADIGAALPLGTPICVSISLEGGCDYLDTLVPVDNPWYFDATYGRGGMAVDPATTLPLTGQSSYALNKGLPYLANRWNTSNDVAFVLGIGEQNKQDFSHFDSIAFWQTADTTLLEPTGWLGRFNDLRHPALATASVSLGGVRKDTLGTTAPTLAVNDTSTFVYSLPGLDTALFKSGLDQMSTIGGGGYLQQASSLISTTFAVADQVHAATDTAITGGGPYGDLTTQLLQAAELIRAGIPSQTYSANFGPFDSHGDQATMLAARFSELNTALSKFFGALADSPRVNDVFVMITSEFGRQATGNVNLGTDHGQSGMGIFIGGGAKGGVYGLAPTLDPGGATRPNRIYDALKPTIDFRAMHATAVGRLADAATAQTVLRGAYPDLGVFSGGPPPPPPPPASTTTTTAAPTTTTTQAPATTSTTAPPAPTTTTTRPPATTTTTRPPTTTTVLRRPPRR